MHTHTLIYTRMSVCVSGSLSLSANVRAAVQVCLCPESCLTLWQMTPIEWLLRLWLESNWMCALSNLSRVLVLLENIFVIKDKSGWWLYRILSLLGGLRLGYSVSLPIKSLSFVHLVRDIIKEKCFGLPSACVPLLRRNTCLVISCWSSRTLL